MLVDLVKSGDLTAAVEQAMEGVRKAPAKAEPRTALFELSVIAGNWDRAWTQLQVVKDMDAATIPMVYAYGPLIRCEKFRSEIFAGRKQPLILGEPPAWIAPMIEAIRFEVEGNQQAADDLRGQALEKAAAVPGRLNGTAFEWIADSDSRLGPVVEAMIEGKYYWVPFERIRSLSAPEPKDLRDMVWVPATITWGNGGDTPAFLPVRYPGSESSEDEAVRASMKTVWEARSESSYHGLGQRTWVTDTDQRPLLEVRELELDGGDDA